MELRDGDLELRPWTLEDVPVLAAALNDPEIHRWMPVIPHPYTEDDARTFIERTEEHAGRHQFAIVEQNRVVGGIGLDVDDYLRQGTTGYWCANDQRGRGIVARALRLLSAHAFDELGVERMQLYTDPANHASQRVAEKVGYRREGVLRSHLPHGDGRRADSVVFALLPGELV
jgi:RimJ/RimL family protein N-acetyltransferase